MKHTLSEHGTLRVVVDADPPVLLICLVGELDVTGTEAVRAVPTGGWGAISSVRVDLSRLTFSDSAGMQALLELKAKHRALGREVQIVNASPVVRRLCATLGEDSLLAT